MRVYRVADTAIGVDGPRTPVVTAIETLFALCPPTGNPATLRIDGRSVDQGRMAAHLPEWLRGMLSQMRPSHECYYFRGPNAAAAISKTPQSVSCAWRQDDAPVIDFLAGTRSGLRTPLVVQATLLPLLRDFFLQSNRVLLHSAAVKLPDDTGVLIAAPGFGGKTTTAMALVRAGARLLGDDLTVIAPTDDGLRAVGIPEPFNLTDQTIAFFEECRHVSEMLPKHQKDLKKTLSPIDIFGPECLTTECAPRRAYFVRVSSHGPATHRLSTAEAMRYFSAANLFAHHQLPDGASTAALLDLTAQVRAYTLETGPDPVRLGRWLERHARGGEL